MNKSLIGLILLITIIGGCKEKSHHDHHGHTTGASDAIENSENQVLYNEVMKIHDEVMPKMEDLHKKKTELKNKLTDSTSLSDDQKKEIKATIARLDSAGESMMVWMRQFTPVPDSEGEEKAREYLENEMERVKKVRENILQALKDAEDK